jgi:hypothetical protein
MNLPSKGLTDNARERQVTEVFRDSNSRLVGSRRVLLALGPTSFHSQAGGLAFSLFFLFLTTQRVPLDKSEGPVKQKLSLAMPEHRFVGHRTLSTKTLESTFT